MQDIESPKLAKVNKRSERFLKDGTDILAIYQSLHFAVYESSEEPFQTLAKLQGYSLYSKREKKNDPSNYRSISLLPAVSKIIEKVVHDQLFFQMKIYYTTTKQSLMQIVNKSLFFLTDKT